MHIETVEGRLDELESENEKLIMECQGKADIEWQARKHIEGLEEEMEVVRSQAKESESKYLKDLSSIQTQHDQEKQEMQAKLVKTLEEVKDLNG